MSSLAGERGFEPPLYGPEPHVLPLDDSPADKLICYQKMNKVAKNIIIVCDHYIEKTGQKYCRYFSEKKI